MVLIPVISITTGSIGDIFVEAENEQPQFQPPSIPNGSTSLRSITYNSRINENFEVWSNGAWNTMCVKGVNMGMAKPGTLPGEGAISYDDYFRWISQIGEMNANTIRVYSINPPQFYKALHDYNKISENKIYLLQGVWICEEKMADSETAFDPAFSDNFDSRISNVIDALHGNLNGYVTPGTPYGMYFDDISEYVLGIILGIEWDPFFVQRTDDAFPSMMDMESRFLKTENGSPFEIWIAEKMDHAVEYETETYYHQTPLSFINYQTLDKMDHPEEPWIEEDMVSVDPDNIIGTGFYGCGLFATFHAYPYYPDFMNYDTTYKNSIDASGDCNNYAGYLNDLDECHDTPILIGEFGVPSSDGISHSNVHGMDQGHLTEEEQGLIDAKLFQTIVDQDLMGGVLFSWQDEWFKTSWNTVDNINRDRNPEWYNSLNCEENYGLLSFDPGERRAVTLDGRNDDWLDCNENAMTDLKMYGEINDLDITCDEGYLYFAITLENVTDTEVMILIDTVDEQGANHLPGGFISEVGAEFLIDINGENGSRILVNGDYDTFAKKYDKGSMTNEFNDMRMFLRSEFSDDATGDIIPRDIFEIGILEEGTTDPTHEDFNSNSDIFINRDQSFIEVRIPWNLLNFMDPSSKEIINPDFSCSEQTSAYLETMRIGILGIDLIDGNYVGGSSDGIDDPDLTLLKQEDHIVYEWETWEEPEFHERLKQSYFIMKDIFHGIN